MEPSPRSVHREAGRRGGETPPLSRSVRESRSGTRRVLMLGATGTSGRSTVRALLAAGHEVVCIVRTAGRLPADLHGAEIRQAEVADPVSLDRDGFRGDRFDAIVSCMASRTGAPKDAWAVDYQAHVNALVAARRHGVAQMVLLSAICVQKPVLAFQHAKLAFERQLIGSGLNYSIVRPTAFFKSLSGQIRRLRQGKPFLLFGDGALTACKPIGSDDLGAYLALCLTDGRLHNRILPIGGPGEAITPRQQGEKLFELLGLKPHFRQVPVRMLDAIIGALAIPGAIVPALRDKAELARIGRYYATESMLVLDPATGCYDAAATPSFGAQHLFDYYGQLIRGEIGDDRGDHTVF